MIRVCVFIDGSNMFHAMKRNKVSTRVDYHKLSKALVSQGEEQRRLVRTYYYNASFDPQAFPDKAATQRPFFDALDRTPQLELRLGRIVADREGKRMEKGVDVKMSSDIVYYAARDFFDTAIVVTEDQDFAPAVALTKEMGKQIEIAVFSDGLSREMSRVADRVLYLNQIMTKEGVLIQGGPEQEV